MKGVKQGYMMSPLLFNLYIADIDNELEKRGLGGVRLSRDRIWSLAYADDLVLVAYNRETLQNMMSIFKKFLEGRKLELCTEKTKIMMKKEREMNNGEKGKRNGNGGIRN